MLEMNSVNNMCIFHHNILDPDEINTSPLNGAIVVK